MNPKLKYLFNNLSYDSLSSLYYIILNIPDELSNVIDALREINEDPFVRQMFINEYQKRYFDEFLR